MTFCELISELDGIRFIPHNEIGRSVCGQPIYAFFVGKNNAVKTLETGTPATKRILVTGGMHAREWITTLVVIELAKKYFKLSKKQKFGAEIIFIPLTNPDGVRLEMDGLTPFFDGKREFLLTVNSGSTDFSQWKANANAVDINVNFDANWGGGSQNVFEPAPANYVGPYPESEPETQTLVNFVNRIRPTDSIAFHSKGNVIYYGFDQLPEWQIERDKVIADDLGQVTGYTPVQSINSAGGLTDWVALTSAAPSFTAEVGSPEIPHPIDETHLPEIMERVADILDIFL
jgi:g-D-glutamyl-meso-diaminopimelate peptidase